MDCTIAYYGSALAGRDTPYMGRSPPDRVPTFRGLYMPENRPRIGVGTPKNTPLLVLPAAPRIFRAAALKAVVNVPQIPRRAGLLQFGPILLE